MKFDALSLSERMSEPHYEGTKSFVVLDRREDRGANVGASVVSSNRSRKCTSAQEWITLKALIHFHSCWELSQLLDSLFVSYFDTEVNLHTQEIL